MAKHAHDLADFCGRKKTPAVCANPALVDASTPTPNSRRETIVRVNRLQIRRGA